MNYDPLNKAIDEITRPYNTYAGAGDFEYIHEKYVEKYGKNANAQLVKDMFGTSAADKNAFTKGSAEWKDAKRNYDTDLRLVQRWAKGTINPERSSAANRDLLSQVGQALDPLKRDVPKNGITFVLTFKAPEDKGHAARERTTPESGPDAIHLDYSAAYEYVNQEQPQYDTLFDEWFDDGGDTYGEDGDYEVDVTGVSAY